ncbi:hypothetical protein CVT24_001046 [Panaeolus cyanescens]|uniref:ubiquitinyl hydrolase 1 n=1 Tax=Panaeolus cyanescens TaxID=181874 RepID=A0A409W7B0_9AGAR|nr:hypothetical protein CVT24_001046 [Panaeolus cyanescens]
MEGLLQFELSKAIASWNGRLEKCRCSHTCIAVILAVGILSLCWFYFLPTGRVKRQGTDSDKARMDTSSRLDNSRGGNDTTTREESDVVVSKILIHPIKSCKGISVEKARYTPVGLENDRLWCVIDAKNVQVLTAREVPKVRQRKASNYFDPTDDDALMQMVRIETSFVGEGDLKISFPDDSGCESFVVPRTPSEEVLKSWTILPKITLWPTHPPVDGYICGSTDSSSASASDILSRYFGFPVHLVFKGPDARRIDPTTAFPNLEAYAKFQDMYPLLILSEESTDEIEQEMQQHVGKQGIDDEWKNRKIAIERFRPNIVVKGGGPFAEDKWEEISIGSETSPTMTLVSKCTRCLRAQEEAAKKSAVAAPVLPPSSADAKKFGFENFGNTCYANSVLQALYFCTPFRDLLLQEQDLSSSSTTDPSSQAPTAKQPLPPAKKRTDLKHPETAPAQSSLHPIPPSPPTLFSALRSLYLNISTNPAEKGTVAPKAFIDKLKELNEAFRNTQHQDAHEFLNFLLNRIVEEIEEEKKQESQQSPSVDDSNVNPDDLSNSIATLGSKIPATSASSTSGRHLSHATLVHKLFEGVLTSETRCLTCETVSSRDESFLDLSIDIEQNSSLTACLRQFSASEMLCQKNKFFCDSCCDLQEAEKRMKIKKLPNVLALHLKRFKYQEDVGRYIKLTYRVAFPFQLRLFNTVDELDEPDRLYDLFAIVVHIGSGPNTGHYISIIKTSGSWLVFDDDNVYPIVEKDIPKYFGDSNSGSAYVLYYQVVNIDLASLGLRAVESPEPTVHTVLSLKREQFTPRQTLSPTLPPGLNPATTPTVDAPPLAHEAIPPVPTFPPPISPQNSTDSTSISINTDVERPPPQSPSPSNHTPGLPGWMRLKRAPSVTTHTGVGTNANGAESRKSLVEKSPKLGSMTPSWLNGEKKNAESPLPPLPPFATSAAPPPSPSLQTIPQVNEPEPPKDKGDKKDEKKEDKSKGWFGIRRSLRMSDKHVRLDNTTAEIPHSPRLQRGPSENGVMLSQEGGLRPDISQARANTTSPLYSLNKSAHLDETNSAGSASSSPSSSSVLANGHNSTSSAGPSRPSTSPSTMSSARHYDTSSPPPVPSRKYSLATLAGGSDRARGSFEKKKSVDLKSKMGASSIPMPEFAPSPISNSHDLPSSPRLGPNASDNVHGRRPLPATPRQKGFRDRGNISDGTVFAEPEHSHDLAEDRDVLPEPSSLNHAHLYPLRSTTLPPESIGASPGNNVSSDSGNIVLSLPTPATPGAKHAKRKLSLTAWVPRRDKDK